jgi:hypothetical protein
MVANLSRTDADRLTTRLVIAMGVLLPLGVALLGVGAWEMKA